MCDEVTEAENEIYFARLNRREVGVGTGAALAALLAGCESAADEATRSAPTARPDVAPRPTANPATTLANPSTAASAATSASPIATPPKDPNALATTARTVTITTPDGKADAFFVTPNTGKRPGIIMWPDVAGLREAYMTMGTRLAGAGYAVLVVNQYYRSSKAPVLSGFTEWRTDEGKAKIAPMKEPLTPERITSDASAFVAWLDRQKEVHPQKKMGSAGYCMTGSYAFRTAAAVPDRVGVAASFHGGSLVTQEPTSPHLLFAKMDASLLVCIAQNDDEREPETRPTLRRAAEEARLSAEIDVYRAQHGFCCLDTPAYDEAEAERAWGRMLYQFERFL